MLSRNELPKVKGFLSLESGPVIEAPDGKYGNTEHSY